MLASKELIEQVTGAKRRPTQLARLAELGIPARENPIGDVLVAEEAILNALGVSHQSVVDTQYQVNVSGL